MLGKETLRERKYHWILVVRFPQNCWVEVGACAGEQGSRGEANTKFFPLCPSAPLLTTMQSFLGRLLNRRPDDRPGLSDLNF
ncbi:MAG: hypothetical protein V7L01_06330 [Nostoc sp.]|uniref:hypothetical protein n=1 Tax=Nostoc sp. TaxID=1180 RepID=UPI002FF99840